MFRILLGKKCLSSPSCALFGQMQDAGLPLCPECGGQLRPITRIDTRKVAATTAAVLLLSGTAGLLSYGRFVQGFTPSQTVKWIAGQVKRMDRIGFGDESWLTGSMSWWNADGTQRRPPAQYVYERVNSQHRFRPAFTAKRNEWLRFDLNPHTEYTYVIYRAPDQPQVLFWPEKKSSRADRIQVPQGPVKAIRLAGPAATEHFILIASRRPVHDLSNPRSIRSGEQVDRIVGELEQDAGNAAVYHVLVPHN